MQLDEAGLMGFELNDLNEERQDLMDLGVLLRLEIWRPQGDLNPC